MGSVDVLFSRTREIWALHTFKLAILLHLALAITLSFFPLFDVLGFERAFLTGLVSAPLAALLAIAMVAEARRKPEPRPVGRVGAEAALISMLLLLPTVLAGLAVELFRRPCDPGEGVVLLVLTAGVSGIYGASLGTLCGIATRKRLWVVSLVALSLVASLAISLLRLYTEPQIFLYNIPFGYWPGSIYDEEVGLAGALLAHRLYALAVALTLLAAAHALAGPRDLLITRSFMGPKATLLALALAALSIYLGSRGEAQGFDVRRSTVDAALSRVHRTERYTLRADQSMPKDLLERFARDIDYRHFELTEFFGRSPEHLTVYLYRDVGQKRALMGAARTQIAKPWSREIHIHGFDVPHGVLKHELAHVFAAEFNHGFFAVPTAFGFMPNIGVIEGMAVAADWRTERGLSVHESTRAMRDLGLLPDLTRMFYPKGFWSISSSRAYTAAGSFLRHLYERHGRERLLELYATNDFEAAYGQPLAALVPDWLAHLDGVKLTPKHLPKAEQRFKQPAIFEKACAHEVAQLYQEAHAAMGEQDLGTAAKKIERAFVHQPWRTDGFISLAAAHSAEQSFGEARAFLERARDAASSAGARTQAEAALADLAWEKGELEAARSGFEQVLNSHPGEDAERLFLAKRALLERPADVQAVLRPYLLGRTNQVIALVELMELSVLRPEDGLIAYLLGRRLEAVGAYAQGARALEAALELGLPEGPSLYREAILTSGRLLLGANELERAEARFRQAAEAADTEGDRLFALDWADRARFYRAQAPE